MRIHDETRVSEFLKMLEELSTTHLEIGIFEDGKGGEVHPNSKDDKKPITILGIAIVNEFGLTINFKDREGSVTIPERSFMRAGFDTEKGNIIKKLEPDLEKVISLELPVDVFFEEAGNFIVSRIQEYLTNLKDPPNAKSTIANKKGGSNPLFDTGRLRQSITHKVVRN